MCDRRLHDCIYVSVPIPMALWTSLPLGKASTMKLNADRKSLRNFIFMNLKRPLNYHKNKKKKDRRKLKLSCKRLSKVKCIEISYKKCLT